MKTKKVLLRDDVERIVRAAEMHATQNGWAVSIAVVDDGGHALGLIRMDGASPMTPQIALTKASSAAVSRRETKVFEDIINQGRHSFLTVPGIGALMEGGIPVVIDGEVVAAVGVSGVKSPDDAAIARAGIAALAP